MDHLKGVKLNLGCGHKRLDGYINVDKYGEPDLKWDLEIFPWPWRDGQVSDIVLSHVLEHLGGDVKTYLKVVQELYRVCENGALIHISVPHPRHRYYLNDPTHVRAITPEGLELFSKKMNVFWIENGWANTPLALHLDVDFEILNVEMKLDEEWVSKLAMREITEDELNFAKTNFNNVIEEIRILLKVIK